MKGSCLLELSGFNFPPAGIRELFNAADLHHDGVIEYDDFVPVATEILKSQTGMKAKKRVHLFARLHQRRKQPCQALVMSLLLCFRIT